MGKTSIQEQISVLERDNLIMKETLKNYKKLQNVFCKMTFGLSQNEVQKLVKAQLRYQEKKNTSQQQKER